MLYRHRLKFEDTTTAALAGLSELGRVLIRGPTSSPLCFMHDQQEHDSDKRKKIVDTGTQLECEVKSLG
jgi:hypothetical protein